MKKIAILISIVTVITGQINLEELIVIPSEKVQHTEIQNINPNQNSVSGSGAAIITGNASPSYNSVGLSSTVLITPGGSGSVGVYYNLIDSDGNSTWYVAPLTLNLGNMTATFTNSVTLSGLKDTTTYFWKAAIAYKSSGVILALGYDKQFSTIPKPIATDIAATINEGADYSGSFVTNDDAFTFAIITNPTNGIVTLNDASDGSYTYSPIEDYYGLDSFLYSVSDGNLSDTGKVNITINGINDAPELDLVAERAINEDQILNMPISLLDSDNSLDELAITIIS